MEKVANLVTFRTVFNLKNIENFVRSNLPVVVMKVVSHYRENKMLQKVGYKTKLDLKEEEVTTKGFIFVYPVVFEISS